MQRTIREGQMNSACVLNQLPHSPALYGLGPADSLQGEITIWAGKKYHATVDATGHKPVPMTLHHHKAAFFVFSEVQAWTAYHLQGEVPNLQALSDSLARLAVSHGLNPGAPFPFLVKGELSRLRWHVLKKTPIHAPHDPEVHKASKIYFEENDKNYEVLGFFATNQGGIYIHHGARIHVHLVDPSSGLTGHVDEAAWKNAELFFPKIHPFPTKP